MSLEVIRGNEATLQAPLRNRTVAILGYGSQGRAHALNLRDAGLRVVVANRRDSENGRRALAEGFEPLPISSAVRQADLVVLGLPDEVQPEVYAASIEPNLRKGATLGFLHGFAIRYGLIKPRKDLAVVMVAPKGPGAALRERFQAGSGLACLMAIHQEGDAGNARDIALAWAAGIGSARVAVVPTTFENETDTDVFGEQAVLCGGMTWLMIAAFEALVKAGYPPELAYIECCHEVRQIADLIIERGIEGMMQEISNTAEFGAYDAGPGIATPALRTQLEKKLAAVRDGSFARRLRDDAVNGFPWLKAQREELAAHPMLAAGRTVRAILNPGRSVE